MLNAVVGSRSWMGRAQGGQAWWHCGVWSPVSREIHQKRHYRMWVGGQTMAQKQSCQSQGWKVGVEGMVRRCPRPWRTAWGLDIALEGEVGGAAEPANLVWGLLMIDPHRYPRLHFLEALQPLLATYRTARSGAGTLVRLLITCSFSIVA